MKNIFRKVGNRFSTSTKSSNQQRIDALTHLEKVRSKALLTPAETPKEDFAITHQKVKDMIAEAKKPVDTKSLAKRMKETGVSVFGNDTKIMADIEYAEGVKALEAKRNYTFAKEKEDNFSKAYYATSDCTATAFHLPKQGYQIAFDTNKENTLSRAFIKRDRKVGEQATYLWESLVTKSGEQLTATEFSAIVEGKPTYEQLVTAYESRVIHHSRKVNPSKIDIVW